MLVYIKQIKRGVIFILNVIEHTNRILIQKKKQKKKVKVIKKNNTLQVFVQMNVGNLTCLFEAK